MWSKIWICQQRKVFHCHFVTLNNKNLQSCICQKRGLHFNFPMLCSIYLLSYLFCIDYLFLKAVLLNSSSTNNLNASLSSTFGKQWRQKCDSELPEWEFLPIKFMKWPCVSCSSTLNVELSVELSLVETVLSAMQHSSKATVLNLLFPHSELLFMLWRPSKNVFLSLFNWLAKDCSSFFPFPPPATLRKARVITCTRP